MQMGVPVCASYVSPVGPRGWIVEAIDVPILLPGETAEHVRVAPTDFVIGDADGVVVIPEAYLDTILEDAERIVAIEEHTRQRLLSGDDPQHAYGGNRYVDVRPIRHGGR